MAIELTGEEAAGLMHRVFKQNVKSTELRRVIRGDERRYVLESSLCEFYVENDWMQRDGRIRVGVMDKATGAKLELIFSPIHQRDFRAEGRIKERSDRERREYWVRTVGPEAAKAEVDQIYRQIYR